MGGNESIIGDVEYYCYIASKIRNNLNYSIMKRFILIIALISFGLGMAYADGPETLKVEGNDAKTDLVLYQQATKALKDKMFVLKAHCIDNRSDDYHEVDRSYSVSPNGSYVLLNGNDFFMSVYLGEVNRYFSGLHGSVSDEKMKEDKKGNIVVNMLLKERHTLGVSRSRIKLSLQKGTNRCSITCFPIARAGRTIEISGELFPYETSDLVSAGLVDKFR